MMTGTLCSVHDCDNHSYLHSLTLSAPRGSPLTSKNRVKFIGALSAHWAVNGLVGTLVLTLVKHEGALYKEVFPGKIEAHLSVTVKVRGSNSKWRAI